MNKFLPLTGGHPLQLDDFMLMQNSYLEGFTAFISYLSGGTGNTIISGVVVDTSGANVTYTQGYVAIGGEIFRVDAGSFTNSGNPADQIYCLPQQVAIPPSPDVYEDQGTKNVHFQRTVILKYYNSSTDTGGALLAQVIRADAGDIRDWYPPAGTTVNDFFDSTGLGINSKTGWAICNGLHGTPDLRGLTTAGATNIPASGAPAISAAVSGITTNPGDTGGINKATILKANLPNYNLSVTDSGHVHHMKGSATTNFGGDGTVPGVTGPYSEDAGYTDSATTGITVNSGGSGTTMDIRQATKYTIKIMKLN